MKSIKFLLLSIALIANTAQPMSSVATAIAKYAPAFTGVAISNIPWIEGEVIGHLITKEVKEHMAILNEEPKSKSIVNELLDIYAGGEEIKIYSPHNTPGSITDREQQDAFCFGTSKMVGLYAVHRDALEDVNDPMHYASRGIVGHELGHARNYGYFRALGIATQVSTSAGLYSFLRSNVFKRSHWALKPVFWAAAIGIKSAVDFGVNIASGKLNEYLADQNLIQHAKDPRDLTAVASRFKAHGNNPEYKHSFLDTHQHPLVRAEKLEKAADELEKRLAQQKLL